MTVDNCTILCRLYMNTFAIIIIGGTHINEVSVDVVGSFYTTNKWQIHSGLIIWIELDRMREGRRRIERARKERRESSEQ